MFGIEKMKRQIAVLDAEIAQFLTWKEYTNSILLEHSKYIRNLTADVGKQSSFQRKLVTDLRDCISYKPPVCAMAKSTAATSVMRTFKQETPRKRVLILVMPMKGFGVVGHYIGASSNTTVEVQQACDGNMVNIDKSARWCYVKDIYTIKESHHVAHNKEEA